MMIKLIKSMVQIITRPIQNLIISYVRFLVGSPSLSNRRHDDTNLDHHHHVSVLIEDSNGIGRNNVLYAATKVYVFTKINLDSNKVQLRGCEVADRYQGVELKWRIFVDKNIGNMTKESFELRFHEKHRDLVFNSYLPFVEETIKKKRILELHTYIKSKKRILELHIYNHSSETWETTRLGPRLTFDKIAMKEELKRGLIDDLDRFMKRKDFYKKVGRNWTRNYLLHGPTGTGKTSLVAAMADYLNFDVYDLNLSAVMKGYFKPTRLSQNVKGSAILLVEDIDCSVEGLLILSQLLSNITGWFSFGKPRIVIFTTREDMERLDPTLLWRMDMKIYMGRCCFEGFKTLASNYLGLSHDNGEPHSLYPDIKRLIDGQVVMPAQVAESLLESQDVDAALQALVKTLEMKSGL